MCKKGRMRQSESKRRETASQDIDVFFSLGVQCLLQSGVQVHFLIPGRAEADNLQNWGEGYVLFLSANATHIRQAYLSSSSLIHPQTT